LTKGQCKKSSINIKSIFNLIYIYLLFGDFVNLHIFSLRVLIDLTSYIASVRPSTILEFRVSTSWLWLSGVSLLLGPKYSSYHPCRLTGQIDWHALDIGLGVSPLCLQIHFCINMWLWDLLCYLQISYLNMYMLYTYKS
jgi:hypothetical protein